MATNITARHNESGGVRLFPDGGSYADTVLYTRADVTDDEAKILVAADAVESAIYERLNAARADASVVAAKEAHPGLADALEAKEREIAALKARVAELAPDDTAAER